jgi:hypothetical protein
MPTFQRALKCTTTCTRIGDVVYVCVMKLLRHVLKKKKLRRTCISFVKFVRPSIRMEQLGSHWTDFNEILYSSFFPKKLSRKFEFR